MTDTALFLLAAASDLENDVAREMYDAITAGMAHGPAGVMDELVRLGITPVERDRVDELADELAGTVRDLQAADDRVAELGREADDDVETIETLREEVQTLREQLANLTESAA